MFNIQEELKKLPTTPGVYIMRNKKDEIIYIGKAIVLKNRVRQYFQSGKNHSNKIKQMVSNIDHFEYIITDSEIEALVLENNLIKQHRPKYNTMLKDDKSYPYIKVTVSEAYPKVLFSRTSKKDKNKYFGPYPSGTSIRDTLELLNKLYKIRTCNRILPRDIKKERACLNYHIGQCMAPCQDLISFSDYNKQIENVMDFLNGKYNAIVKTLEKNMKQAAEDMEFEKAAEYRDLIKKIMIISERQKLETNDMENRDIIAFATHEDDGIVQIFFIRNGKLLGREHYRIDGVKDTANSDIMSSFIKQFYSGTPYIPRELVIQHDIEGKELIEEWLSNKRGHKVYIKAHVKNEKSRLIELAYNNAKSILTQDNEKIKRDERKTIGAVKEIETLLGIHDPIIRIEAFDISNISGVDSVGSMVCYEKGAPKRSDYRKFKIKWVKGSDDYASMEEVLKRRFTHALKEEEELKEKNIDTNYGSFTKYPDLIMMDGGRGQVNIALKVLKEMNIDIPVCGMVKDDNHRTRGLYYNNIEVPIDIKSEGFKLITRIQDEAHRFAIEYHRNLRGKTQIKSILDDIDGIGTTRRKALMQHFASIENIKSASIDELETVEGMNKKSAQSVYDFFH